MIRLLHALFVLTLLSFPALAQNVAQGDSAEEDAERLWFTVTTEPEAMFEKGGWVGEEIILDVHFVSSDPFKRLRLELPKIEGARVETLVRPHTLQINMLGGRGYSHEARLAIVPTRSGTLTIPQIRVTGIAQQRNGRSVEFAEVYPEQNMEVKPPPVDYGGAAWVVPRELSMEQNWSADINTLRAGDTIRRTVVLDVRGVRAEDLPELTLNSNEGYRVLSNELNVETIRTAKGFSAKLTQSWDLFIETDEITYIDAVHFPYWDTATATTAVAQIPPQRVEPILRDAKELRDQLREEAVQRHQTQRLGLIALLALPLAAFVVIVLIGIWHALPTRADLRMKRSVRDAGSPAGFYPSFQEWGRETFGVRRPVEQARIAELGEDATLRSEELNLSIFARGKQDADVARTASAMVRGARRRRVAGYFSTLGPAISRMLFLK